MFNIEMLPAERGDCLIIEYGDAVRPKRILIDGGPVVAYPQLRTRILDIPEDQREFELLVITHIDQDHIEGIVKLLKERGELRVRFKDIWFNGLRHLSEEQLGVSDAEELTDLLEGHLPWNEAFGGKAVAVPNDGDLPTLTLPGGMKLILLSPTRRALRALLAEWNSIVAERGIHSIEDETGEIDVARLTLGRPNVEELAGMAFKLDRSKPNWSSIAFIAEYDGKRFLATGDAFPTVLVESLKRMLNNSTEERIRVHAFKPSHHGSRGSLNVDVVRLLNCDHFLISTSGDRFKHPTQEAIARILLYGGGRFKLWFNYYSEFNKMWHDLSLRDRYRYDVEYPTEPNQGVTINLAR